MNLLTMKAIHKEYTDKVLLEHEDLGIEDTDKIGIVGINGTGKSTLLRLISGLEKPDEGEVVKGSHVKISFLSQSPRFSMEDSVFDYVVGQNKMFDETWHREGEVKELLNRLGFERIDEPMRHLSGGQKKKAALAATLLQTCEILVLDEPTNHLNYDMVVWLEQYLKARRGAFVMVTHDRYFLDRVCNRIVEIDQGRLYSYQSNFEGFLELKAEREEMEQASYRKNQSILRTELAWIQRGARARSTKQKARIERYEERRDRQAPMQQEQVEMSSLSSYMGKKTIEASHVSKAFGDRQILRDFSYLFLKNDRVGFIGPNGCGKSTFMNLLTGKLEPDEGTVEVGQTIKMGYFMQENEELDPSQRVIDYVKETAEFIRTKDGLVSASKMLERFLFDSALQYAKIEKLSGGEKRRLYLLKILMDAPNVLILDEPTNDLDIQTLAILEDYLLSFDGIVITVSHDRYFLDKVVRRIFAYENGTFVQYDGNFSDYYEKVQLKEAAEQPAQTAVGQEKEKYQKIHEKKLKFSYKEQKEYDTIEADIEKLENEAAKLEQQMTENATDFVKLKELTEQKERCEQQLEEKMDRYVYLEELAEKIARQSGQES